LPQVKCPQCGAVNDIRAPGYPFCVGCRDNLAKCGYCRWFDNKSVVCTHPVVAGVFAVSETATPPCVYHTPKERVLTRRRGRQVLAWVLLATAVFVLGYGVARLMQPGPPVAAAPMLELAVEADYGGAVVDQPYTVMVLIYNSSDVVAERVRFEIARRSLDEFHLREVMPQPTTELDRGQWRMFSYPPLNPRERRRIALTLVPTKAGKLDVVVRLVSGDGDYHGMADLPVIVSEKGAEGRAESEAEGEDAVQ
jgi:hypothetical protein